MSSTRYIIEGGLVTREEYSQSALMPLEGLLDELTAYQPLELSHMPKGMRALKVTPGGQETPLELRMLIEQEPTKRIIKYKNCGASSTGRVNDWRVQLPYTYFWIVLKGARIHGAEGEQMLWTGHGWGHLWSNAPYSGSDHPMWMPQFPNIFGESRICFGGVRHTPGQSLANYVDATINGFWTSEFNKDLDWYDPFGGRFEGWSQTDQHWTEWDMWQGGIQKPFTDWVNQFGNNFQWTQEVPADNGGEIPAMRIFPTFNNVEEWLAQLEPQQRERVVYAVEAINARTTE